jgi:putative ABC transport system permease protein
MKYLPVIFKNILRNRRRTILVFISIAFALFLFVFLFTVLSSMNKIMYRPSIANNIIAYSESYDVKHHDLPESYITKIKALPHVLDANPCLQILTYFEQSTKVVNVWGINPVKLGEIMDITRIDGMGLAELSRDTTGALVGYYLMEEYKWKIGDRIILKSGTGFQELPFTIRGIVHGLSNASYIVYANLGYLQDVLDNRGRVSFTYIKVDDPFIIPQMCRKLEELFHNYPVQITTITQKSFMDSIVDKIKAILIAFRLIGCIALISTFLLVTNCIAISIRERTSELGVMRVLGFSRTKIMALVLAESAAVTFCGGMVGVLLAYLIPMFYHITIPATVPLHVYPDAHIALYGMIISMLIGLLGSAFPALHSVLMKPGEAIRSIG